jgi:uncharacterized membrane protein YccC
MQLTKMKIEKRDIPVIALCALGGFLLIMIALASRSMATVFVGLVAGAPCGAGGGVLACIFRRILEKK